MKTPARKALEMSARSLVAYCERAADSARVRYEKAQALLALLERGGPIAVAPIIFDDEDGPRAAKAIARVDALMMAVHFEESPEDLPTLDRMSKQS
jgi:cytosine/adenosine deaminase-related metal-dependent hydrolase